MSISCTVPFLSPSPISIHFSWWSHLYFDAIYVHVYLWMTLCLSVESRNHEWEKTCNACLLQSEISLNFKAPFFSIFLQMTLICSSWLNTSHCLYTPCFLLQLSIDRHHDWLHSLSFEVTGSVVYSVIRSKRISHSQIPRGKGNIQQPLSKLTHRFADTTCYFW